MKVVFVYILLVLTVGDWVDLGNQLTKVPKLFEHFNEHKTLNPSVSLLDYLAMHYWGTDLDDNDDDKDMQLPFKKFDISSPNFIFFLENKPLLSLPRKWSAIPYSTAGYVSEVYHNPVFGSLFRPPQA